MTMQTEMFPKTTLELLEELAEIHRAEYDKAMKALDALSDDEKIAKAYEKAEDRVAKARDLVASIDQVAKRERGRLTTTDPARSVMQETVDIVNSGALDTEDITVTASVTPAVDPITGEVTSIPVSDWKCPTCSGDGRLPDKTGGGHHRCKACNGTGHVDPSCDNCTGYGDCNISQCPGSDTMGCGGRSWVHGEMMGEPNVSVVVVLYPGSDEPVVTKIGEKTRYGELVADYFTAAGLGSKHDAKDWTVVARRELTQGGGGYRSLRDVITPEDYGQELLVVALEQGSVVGEQGDVQEANELLEDAVR